MVLGDKIKKRMNAGLDIPIGSFITSGMLLRHISMKQVVRHTLWMLALGIFHLHEQALQGSITTPTIEGRSVKSFSGGLT